MRGVDLNQFQFDFDLTMTIFFVAPDGTILGRFCASGKDREQYNTLPALRKAAERALLLFENLDTNREALAGKKRPSPVARVEDLPNSEIKDEAEDNDLRNCVHCHNVQEGMNKILEKDKDYHPDMVASKFPLPEQVGFVIEPDDGLLMKSVIPGSAADLAGLMAKDSLLKLAGQPLISVADMTWALGAVSDPGETEVLYRRGTEVRSATLKLSKGWKPADLLWRTSIYQMRPFLRLWVEDAGQDRRRELGVANDELALTIRGVNAPNVKAAGLKVGDVVVGLAEMRERMGPAEFHLHIRLNYFARGAKIPLVINRNGKTKQIDLKL